MFLLATPGVAQTSAALSGLQNGIWELRDVRRTSRLPEQVCVQNAARLVQIRHARNVCPRRVLSEDSRSVTIRYECESIGWGQTTIDVETPRLVRIDTQGIEGGSPFHNVYEARRTGDC